MPGSPKEESKDINGQRAIVFTASYDKGFFSAQHKQGPKIGGATKELLQEFFAEWLRNTLADKSNKVMKDQEANFDDKSPGRFFEIQQGRLKQQVRIILANDKTYVLMAAGTSDWSGWEHAKFFFDSFRFAQ